MVENEKPWIRDIESIHHAIEGLRESDGKQEREIAEIRQAQAEAKQATDNMITQMDEMREDFRDMRKESSSDQRDLRVDLHEVLSGFKDDLKQEQEERDHRAESKRTEAEKRIPRRVHATLEILGILVAVGEGIRILWG